MYINKIKIKNFKCYDEYEMIFNKDINVLAGANDVGKSTILEAIHICLTGFFRGKYLKNNLTQDVFNYNAIQKYLEEIKTNKQSPLPVCIIELYFEECDPILLGKENSDGENVGCVSYKIEFDSKYDDEYQKYINSGEIFSLPIEYYKVTWKNSADKDITGRTTPVKSTIIDTSDNNLRNSSDSYISRIVKDNLEEQEVIEVSQLYRRLRDSFIEDEIMQKINSKLSENTHILDTKVQIDVESLKPNEWEKNVITKINLIPFEFIGKGIQSAIKIELSLNTINDDSSQILLIEEPENHLSYSKMNKLLNEIIEANKSKQVFITTHSGYVANKLNLNKLLLLNGKKYVNFSSLTKETYDFFMKKPGYDTLRFLLCKKAILVEGDSDELIIQKAYQNKYGKLPIEDEIDVISVGTTFLRFLEIADKVQKKTIVVTDNDGNIGGLLKKYYNYVNDNKKEYIDILYDKVEHKKYGTLRAKNGGDFNYDTLEPCMVRANSLELMNKVLNQNAKNEDEIIKYMVDNKTECALKIFETSEDIKFPSYVENAINE